MPKIGLRARIGRATRSVIVVAAGLACALPASRAEQAEAREARCPSANVIVRVSSSKDMTAICEAAGKALDFLAGQGLDVSHPVRIDVANELPSIADRSAVGCFLRKDDRVVVLSYAEFARHRTWFELPIDRALYASLVVHEVAHAVAACNFRMPKPSLRANEYVAYVTMLSTMPAALRDRVLANYPGTGYDDDVQIDDIIYLMNPMRFGVEVYRHFLKPGNGRDYLWRLLEGKALVD